MPTAAPTSGLARCLGGEGMGMQQGSAICRYFAKSGGCKSGDTCRFFHEPALAVTVTPLPGGIEFAARRRGDPAVSEERRRDESDGGTVHARRVRGRV